MILPRMLNADAEGVECDRDPKVDFCHCHPKERKKVGARVNLIRIWSVSIQ